jgi:hypothetical protein
VRRIAALVAVMLFVSPAIPAGAGTSRAELPAAGEVVRIFDPLLEPLGLRITRANLVSLSTGRYDDDGHHLAVYAEPTGDYTDAEYVKNFRRVAAIFLPKVFRRWSSIESFDVCQEPLPAIDPSPEPIPITQITVSRGGAKGIHWSRASLADLLVVATRHQADETAPEFSLFFDESVKDEPAFVRSEANAARRSESR